MLPAYGEILSDETRKTQMVLVIVAGLLLLLVLDVVEFSGAIELGGLHFSVTAKGSLVQVGSAVCGYFLTLYLVRAYIEWSLFTLKLQVTDMELNEIVERFRTNPLETEDAFSGVSRETLTRAWRVEDGIRKPPLSEAEAADALTKQAERSQELAQTFNMKINWFRRSYQRQAWSWKLRALIEVIFPASFSGLSLVLAFLS
jgi:hypothetical protein